MRIVSYSLHRIYHKLIHHDIMLFSTYALRAAFEFLQTLFHQIDCFIDLPNFSSSKLLAIKGLLLPSHNHKDA